MSNARADSAVVESLKQSVQHLAATIDSMHHAANHMVSVSSDSLHPILVRALESKSNGIAALVTHPVFTFVWSAVVGVLAFAAGRIYELWNDQARRNDAKWTSARLTRRYLLLVRDQIKELIKRREDPNGVLAEAHVSTVLRAVGDFEEIKTRMIALEDDDVEEAVFQWNLVTTDDLLELSDRVTMHGSGEYYHKYGLSGPIAARDAAIVAALSYDAGKADDVIAMLEPYLKLRKAKITTLKRERPAS